MRRRRTATARVFVALSTAPPRDAARIASALLAARVAACVNLVQGVASVYRWKGRIERARETLLVIKTTKGALTRCRQAIERLHPYEVPEWLVFEAEDALPAYRRWVEASTL